MNRFVWRSRLSLAAWALAAGLLSACGGGSDTPQPTETPPPPASYGVGGVVTGLSGTVVLREAGGQQVSVSGNGSFALGTQLPAGTPYAISVAQQPVGQVCSVSNGSGTANANVASIAVACQAQTFPIGAQVLALTQPIVLQSNLGDSLTVTVAGTYTLPTPVAYGQPYSVTAQSPAGQSCILTGAQGIAAAPGVNLSVTCQAVVVAPPPPPLVEPPPPPPPPPVVVQVPPATPANLAVSFGVKSYAFAWSATADTTHYQLFEDPDGPGALPSVQAGGNIPATTTTATVTHAVLLHRRLNAQYTLRACNAAGCGPATAALQPDLTQAIGYFKASNTGAGDGFGSSVAISGDGNTLAVGALLEASNATGIGGNQANNSAGSAGAVYVFTRSGAGLWSQQAYLKASNTDAGDQFGRSVALSDNGSTLAVGATEDSSVSGINGGPLSENNNGADAAGAVYVFTRSGGNWSQQAYLKASNTDAGDQFGFSVALSGDGATLAVGARLEDNIQAGLIGDPADNSASDAGAVYVFTRSGGNWSQQAYLKASNTDAGDQFGFTVALSGDGATLAVGATGEDSIATGIGGDQADNSAPSAGAVYVFTRSGGTWSQQAYIKASNTGGADGFGTSIALSADGATLAVGARGEDSIATGIGGNQANNSAGDSGAVYVLTRSGVNWSQQAYIKASNTDADDLFGERVALSADGNTLAVGATQEGSNATDINGSQGDNTAVNAGAVYLY